MNRNQLTRHKLANSIQSMLLVGSMMLILGTLGWLLGGGAFSFLAVCIVVLLYFLNAVVSPRLILRLHRCRVLSPYEAPRLYGILQTLSRRAGLSNLPELFLIPERIPNAFTAGTSENAAIALSEGLLDRLDARETAAVLAHEVSHIRNSDIHILRFADISSRLTNTLSMVGQILLILNLPLFLLGRYSMSWIAILLLIFAPSISILMQLALSRVREFNADLGSADLMGDPEALVSALYKIEQDQRRFINRFFWPGYYREPEVSMLRTHPPTKERIRRLKEIQDRPYSPLDRSIFDLPPHTIYDHMIRGNFHSYNRPEWRLLKI